MKQEIETITPQIAQKMLATSYGNRSIQQASVLEYAVSMDTGKWSPTASRILIDEKDKLIDGHHRLHAVLLLSRPIEMLVARGVPSGDRDVIDTGRKRSLNDLTTMYTTRTNVHAYNAAMNICATLVVKGTFRRPRINTLDMAKKWGSLFSDGLEYCVGETTRVYDKQSHLRVFRLSYVCGAFAFAYKRNPSAIKTFLKRCMSGESIDSTMPVYTVRNAILSAQGRVAVGGGGISPLTIKILSGLYASIKGESYKTAQAGKEGWDYFLEAYETAQVKNLVEPYLRLTKGREDAAEKLKKEIRARAS